LIGVCRLFLDCEINPFFAPFSIQNVTKVAFKNYKTKPGEWYKASTICMTLADIME